MSQGCYSTGRWKFSCECTSPCLVLVLAQQFAYPQVNCINVTLHHADRFFTNAAQIITHQHETFGAKPQACIVVWFGRMRQLLL